MKFKLAELIFLTKLADLADDLRKQIEVRQKVYQSFKKKFPELKIGRGTAREAGTTYYKDLRVAFNPKQIQKYINEYVRLLKAYGYTDGEIRKALPLIKKYFMLATVNHEQFEYFVGKKYPEIMNGILSGFPIKLTYGGAASATSGHADIAIPIRNNLVDLTLMKKGVPTAEMFYRSRDPAEWMVLTKLSKRIAKRIDDFNRDLIEQHASAKFIPLEGGGFELFPEITFDSDLSRYLDTAKRLLNSKYKDIKPFIKVPSQERYQWLFKHYNEVGHVSTPWFDKVLKMQNSENIPKENLEKVEKIIKKKGIPKWVKYGLAASLGAGALVGAAKLYKQRNKEK